LYIPANRQLRTVCLPAFLDHQHLVSFFWSVTRLSVWLVLLAVIFLPLERLTAVHPRKFFCKSLPSDIGFYFISGLIPGLLLAPPMAVVATVAHQFVPYSVHAAVAAMPIWARAVAALVVGEIGFYWGHRWAHEIPLLWRFHAVHHNPAQVYFLISARAHPIDNVFVRLCGFVPISVLGIATPLTPSGGVVSALLVLVLTLWGFVIHANVRWRLGPLEWLVSTPAFHHWHHTLAEPRDRNFASMLPCMDWIFGTHYLPRDRWPSAYGIDGTLPVTLGGQLLCPFRSEPSQFGLSPPLAVDPQNPPEPGPSRDNGAGVEFSGVPSALNRSRLVT
jgi:sterol desaturase/sphingolipid hydroxylase (fatty acid hydroxylase superfamily)